MGLSVTHRTRAPATPASDHAEVVWHDLECGSYRADLPLWRELAARNPGPILEIGAGTGRVALELARAGHVVTALEREPALLDALRRRPGAERARTVCADARGVELPQARFALCLVPMQMIQLLSGPSERARFLSRVRATLRRGGLLACAVLARVDPCLGNVALGGARRFAALRVEGRARVRPALAAGYAAAEPCLPPFERRPAAGGGPLFACGHARRKRERRVFPGERDERPGASDSDRALARARCVVELDRVSEPSLRREGAAAGLRPLPSVTLAATEDHVGSTVVMLGA